MGNDDFRPRIRGETHRRLRLQFFDDNVDFSDIYEDMAETFYNEEGEEKEWYARVNALSEEQDVTFEQALENVVVSVVDSDGKFKPGAQQIYARNNSIGE